MSLLVVGSVAYDSVRTPAGSRERALGGSAVYFSVAASCLTDVSLVGIVGDDFEWTHVRMLEARGVDVSGLEYAEGRTFHWSGVYFQRGRERARDAGYSAKRLRGVQPVA